MDLFSNLDTQQLNTILDKVTKHFSKEPTYSLRIIIEWLSSKNIPYVFCSSRVDNSCMYQTGVRATIKNNVISIQTHPTIAGWAFAETLITSDMLSDTRHKTPEDLFAFLESIENTEDTENTETHE